MNPCELLLVYFIEQPSVASALQTYISREAQIHPNGCKVSKRETDDGSFVVHADPAGSSSNTAERLQSVKSPPSRL